VALTLKPRQNIDRVDADLGHRIAALLHEERAQAEARDPLAHPREMLMVQLEL
jgi:hypothetical protein